MAMSALTAPIGNDELTVDPVELPPLHLDFANSETATQAPSDSLQIDRYDLFMQHSDAARTQPTALKGRKEAG